jgi:phage baseplate assembly protein W
MSTDLLGRGWAFPLIPDSGGALRYVDGELDVEQALKIVLLTKVGERAMRPDFGSQVASYLFAPGSDRYLGLLEGAVREAVRDFEPRVDLLQARATVDPDEATRVVVSIDYLVRRTNNRQNLVFPFYLPAGAG